jgi:hypothetical protein
MCKIWLQIALYGEKLPPPENPSWRNTPCQRSATAYSIYSQLFSISEDHFLYPQPEDNLVTCDGRDH